MRISAIINGISRNHDSCSEELAALNRDIAIHTTRNLGDAIALTHSACNAGAKLIIVAGGDGTLNECVNGVMSSNRKDVLIGILPIGSANDYARNIETNSVKTTINLAHGNSYVAVDAVRLEHNGNQKFLCNVSAAGIGAEIAATVNRRRFRLNAAVNYYSAILKWLAVYKAPVLEIDIDGKKLIERCFLAAVGKGTYAGNGLGLIPQVSLVDGRLGLTIAGNISVLDFLRFQKNLKAARRILDPRVQYLSGKRIRLTVKQGSLAVDTDGEYQYRLQAGESITFDVLPGALRLVTEGLRYG